jgi:hypothetical protein
MDPAFLISPTQLAAAVVERLARRSRRRFVCALNSGSSGGKVIEDQPSEAARHTSCISPISIIETLA